MDEVKLYVVCDYWDDFHGEWCEDGEMHNAEGLVEDIFGEPITCPKCDGTGFVRAFDVERKLRRAEELAEAVAGSKWAGFRLTLNGIWRECQYCGILHERLSDDNSHKPHCTILALRELYDIEVK